MARNSWGAHGRWLAAAFAIALLSGCSEASDEDGQYVADELGLSTEDAATLIDEYGDADAAIEGYLEDYREPFDEDAARQAAEDELAAEGYDYRYGCTEDCSGHDAGWEWRAENGYSTPGYSNSFEEGGLAFDEAVEERVEEMQSEYEAGVDPGY